MDSPELPTGLRLWLVAARPATFPAAIAPVLVGTAIAGRTGAFQPLPFVAALLASMLIQVGTNLANDYFDFQRGADTAERLGPLRVTQAGLMAPTTVRFAMQVAFGLAMLLGVYLFVVGGWVILLIGLLCIASGVLYTGGPWPLAYHGLGDLACFVFFGPVAVMGTAYLQTRDFSLTVFILSLPVAALVTAILVVNNLRDVDTDRSVGKRTFAVYIGAGATRLEYVLLLTLAYAVPLGFWVSRASSAWVLLPFLSIPLAAGLVRRVRSQTGRPLNLALKQTGQLHLLFATLLSAAILIG